MKADQLHITCGIERWPLARPFVIARGAKTHADVVVVRVEDDNGCFGRGECVPYARYSETPDTVVQTITSWCPDEVSRRRLQDTMPAGAARNALDCALWDYEAKVCGQPVADRVGKRHPSPAQQTCFTISLDTPDAMAAAAHDAREYGLLKLKLGSTDGGDDARMHAVRAARPDARLVGDANEGWRPENVAGSLALAAQLNFEMIEQPLSADQDQALADFQHPLPVCADESHHTHDDIAALASRYDAINIKLDKAGGLSGALLCLEEAERHDLSVMVGCMVATSLAIAPAALLGHDAKWVDLDGPVWLSEDRTPGFHFKDGTLSPPASGLWGTAD